MVGRSPPSRARAASGRPVARRCHHDAQEASIAIIQTLAEGQTPEALTAATQQAHIFTLLRNAYDDVLTTARWLLRHEPHRLGDFQSLHFNPAPRRRGAAAATVEPEPA